MTVAEDRQQAANLTDQTASALVAARSAMMAARDATADFDRLLEARLEEAGNLGVPAQRARESEYAGRLADSPGARDNATDDIRRALYSAGLTSDQLNGRLQRDIGQLEQIGDDLDRSSRALTHGKSSLDDLEQLPVERDEQTGEPTPEAAEQLRQTSILRQRVSTMENSIGTASTGVKNAETQLKAARETARRLVHAPPSVGTDGRISNAIEQTREELGSNLRSARQRLDGANQDLTAGRPAATEAAQRSIDLANATRAGLNPTPPSHDGPPGGPSGSDLSRRLNGPSQNPTLER
ncbi:hypothetical protein OHA70_25050 [Kribbella sp. NBC_00382]|uniref:hypothetical protein n=1 Tax=Kribbella sp. NBC_00382 TaxID=2975967 RepID=UPI002E21C229